MVRRTLSCKKVKIYATNGLREIEGVPCVLATALFATMLPSIGSAASISIAPSTATIVQGDALTLNVNVDDAAGLFLFQFGVSYNPLVFFALEPQRGSMFAAGSDFISGCPFVASCGPSPAGTITLISGFGDLVDPLATGGTLAVLSFRAIAPATSSLISLMIDAANLDGLFDSSFNPIDVSQVGGALTTVNAPQTEPFPQPEPSPAPVPEPATLGLVLAGLCLGIRKKRT